MKSDTFGGKKSVSKKSSSAVDRSTCVTWDAVIVKSVCIHSRSAADWWMNEFTTEDKQHQFSAHAKWTKNIDKYCTRREHGWEFYWNFSIKQTATVWFPPFKYSSIQKIYISERNVDFTCFKVSVSAHNRVSSCSSVNALGSKNKSRSANCCNKNRGWWCLEGIKKYSETQRLRKFRKGKKISENCKNVNVKI